MLFLPVVLRTVLKPRVINYDDVFVALDAESAGAVQELSLTDLAFTDGVPSREADDLDMVAIPLGGECEEGRSEEHGFIVRMADQEDDGFIAKLWWYGKGRCKEYRCEEPEAENDEEILGHIVERHGERRLQISRRLEGRGGVSCSGVKY